MFLNKIDDPRDQLERARRFELFKFAKANNVNEITEGMPAIIMRKILRGKGLTRIAIPPRPLGMQSGGTAPATATPQNVNEIDAADDLMRQYAQESKPAEKPVSEMDIKELRSAAKARGVKLERTDNMAKIREKLSGKNAA